LERFQLIVSMIAAVAENGVIGSDGGMPWRLSTDMLRFKALTMGKPVLMGRRTWQSFPKRPLPGRVNIVVTRDTGFAEEGAVVVHSVEEGVERAGAVDELCVIGGGQIYAQMMDRANRLDITHVLAELSGDTLFPTINSQIWRLASEERFPAGERDDHATRFAVYKRRR
jgi:dihydrofolate reductase